MDEPQSAFDRNLSPLHRSLAEPMMTAGLPTNMAILLGTLGLCLVFITMSFYALILLAGIYIGARRLSVYDPEFLPILLRHFRMQQRYKGRGTFQP